MLEEKAETTTLDTINFIVAVMDELDDGNAGRRRCFLADNLISQKNLLVKNTVFVYGHQFIFRPPYAPWIAPTEYLFNVIQCMPVLKMHTIKNIEELRIHIARIVFDMGEFSPYFIHYNYSL